jgi:chromosome segregation ATPase
MPEFEITLHTLYELLQSLTVSMDERFDRVDQRFDLQDQRSEAADKRTDAIESKLGRIESVQNTIALRLITVETTVLEHSRLLSSLDTRVHALHGLVEELERRTGRIEQEYIMITEALRRLEGRFDKLEADRLRERIAALEARVQALETAQA